MKRKNLLTNIATVVLQIVTLIWFLMNSSEKLGGITLPTIAGTIAFILLVLIYLATLIINLIVGIANRKESKARMVLNIVNSVLILAQPILFLLAEYEYETIYSVLMVIVYVAIYGIEIALFILNRKASKSEKNTKLDIIIFVIIMIMIIPILIIQPIYLQIVKNKIEEYAVDEETLNKQQYVIGYADRKQDFINIDNGNIDFSFESGLASDVEYIKVKDNKYVKLIVIEKRKTAEIIDLSTGTPKTILKTTGLFNSLSMYSIKEIYPSGLMWNSDEETESKLELEYEEDEKYKQFEENSDATYKYYSNGEMTIQVENSKTDNIMTNEEGTSQYNDKYYLIKEDQKIKLECKELFYTEDDEILIYDKYIPYKNDQNVGYFNENGQKVAEINNKFIFLDVNDTTSVVAIRNMETQETKNIEEYEANNSNAQMVLVDKNLNVVGDKYIDGYILNDFYIFKKLDNSSYDDYIWDIVGKNGKKVKSTSTIEIAGKNILVIYDDDEGEYVIYYNGKKVGSYKSTKGTERYYGNEEGDLMSRYEEITSDSENIE